MTQRYKLHGIVFDSPFDLAGPITSQPADLLLRVVDSFPSSPHRGLEVLAEVDEGHGRRQYVLRKGGSGWEMDFTGAAVVRVDTSTRVASVTLPATTSPALLSVLLSGPFAVAAAMMAGSPVLHASAALVDGRALAFVGRPGAGKSTLAAVVQDPGAAVFSDDALVPVRSGDGIEVLRGTSRTRLRQHRPMVIGDAVAGGASADGRFVYEGATDAGVVDSAPLRAVVVPLLSPAFDTVRGRLVEGAPAATSMDMALSGVRSPELLASHFHAAVDVAQRVRVVALEVPWSGQVVGQELREAVLDELRTVLTATSRVRGRRW